VTVDPPPGKPADVEVRIPDTELFGTVEDASGASVPGAEVVLSSPTGLTQSTSDREGRFEFRGGPTGTVGLAAERVTPDGKESSDEELVELVDGQPRGPVRLVLHREIAVAGRVLSPHGPVAGAAVRVMVLAPLGATVKPARTDLDGGFRVTVLASASALGAVVSAPGFGLRAVPFSVEESKEALLSVSEEIGEVQIELPKTPGDKDTSLVILQDGLPLPLGVLAQWALGHGTAFETANGFDLPALAPARYRACLALPSLVDAEQKDRCAEGFLSAGGLLRLRIENPSN